MDSQPELFAQHYAEAGLVEKSIAWWGKAGRRSVDRSALAEAVAQFQRALHQLALMPDTTERKRQELEIHSALGTVLLAVKGFAAPETGQAYARAGVVGAARLPLRVSSDSIWAVTLSCTPRRIGFGAALG
jgi:predicted ATPase